MIYSWSLPSYEENEMRNDVIERTKAYVRQELMKLAGYPDAIPRMAEYRVEHSIRVAHIAGVIARAEGFSEERAVMAGLLHDIGYALEYKTKEDYRNHGRYGAKIAGDYLKELQIYSNEEIEEICYGIAIHVDDEADFEGERTPLALTVGDADNIDRFDAYRLYESLQFSDYMNLSLADQKAYLKEKISRLERLRDVPCGTAAGTALWQEKIDYQLAFHRRLQKQAEWSE